MLDEFMKTMKVSKDIYGYMDISMRHNPHNNEKPRQRHEKIYSNSKCNASIQMVCVVCLALDTYPCLHVLV